MDRVITLHGIDYQIERSEPLEELGRPSLQRRLAADGWEVVLRLRRPHGFRVYLAAATADLQRARILS